MAESKKDKPQTDFYLLYPSNHGSGRDKWDVLGHFKNLTQINTAGFDASSVPAMFMNENHEQGG